MVRPLWIRRSLYRTDHAARREAVAAWENLQEQHESVALSEHAGL